MANFINTILGFDVSRNSVTNVVNATVKVKESLISIGPIFKELQGNVDRMTHVAFWSGIVTSAEKAFGGVKSIVGSVTNDLKKIFEFADSYAEKGDKIAKTSRMLGLSVKDYQAFSSAAIDAGMSVEEMDSALKKFSVNLAKARGGDKTMLHNFSKAIFGTGGDLKALNRLKTTNDVLIALSDGFSKYSTAEKKAFVASELFGKSGLKMSEILSQGGQSLKEYLDSYNRGFSEEGARRAEEFTHELQMMLEEFEGIKIAVAQELFPTFKELFGEILSMLRGEKGSELKKVLKDAGTAFGKFVKDLLPRIPTILENIVRIVDFLTPEVVVAGGMILSMLPTVVSIGISLWAMKPLLFGIAGFVLKIGSGLLKIVGLIGPIMLWIKKSAIGLVLISNLLGGPVLLALGGIAAFLVGMASIVYQFYKNWDMWYSFVNHEMTDAVVEWWSQLKEVVSWAAEGVGNVFRRIGEGVRDFVMGGLNTVYEYVQKIKGFLSGIFSGLPDKLQSLFGLNSSAEIGNTASSAQSSLGSSVAQAVMESNTTTTNRFSVDFKNMPRGVQVTAPDHGDFDYSRGYLLAGV